MFLFLWGIKISECEAKCQLRIWELNCTPSDWKISVNCNDNLSHTVLKTGTYRRLLEKAIYGLHYIARVAAVVVGIRSGIGVFDQSCASTWNFWIWKLSTFRMLFISFYSIELLANLMHFWMTPSSPHSNLLAFLFYHRRSFAENSNLLWIWIMENRTDANVCFTVLSLCGYFYALCTVQH